MVIQFYVLGISLDTGGWFKLSKRRILVFMYTNNDIFPSKQC